MRPKPAQAPGYIDEPIAMVRSWGTTSDTLYYLQGNNYNVEALTDRTGAIVERYAYTPYGEPTVYTAPGTDGQWFTTDDVTASVSARGNALTFQGRELDAETGVYYFRNRYYSAGMGRFVSRDPIRLKGLDNNLVRFEFGSPASWLDPSGLKVLRCSQISDDSRLAMLGLRHVWLKTDRYESGMQPDPNRADEKSFMNDPTWTADHSKRFNDGSRHCEEVTDVDEDCVNQSIMPGRPLKNWTPAYTCADFVSEVLNSCKKKKRPVCPRDNTRVDGVKND